MKMKTKSIIIKTIIQWKVELEFLHVVSLIERLSSRQVDRLTGRRMYTRVDFVLSPGPMLF